MNRRLILAGLGAAVVSCSPIVDRVHFPPLASDIMDVMSTVYEGCVFGLESARSNTPLQNEKRPVLDSSLQDLMNQAFLAEIQTPTRSELSSSLQWQPSREIEGRDRAAVHLALHSPL